MSDIKPRLLTARDVADYLNVSPTTVRRMSERGDLPKPIHLSPGVVRWDVNAIDKILDEKFDSGGQYDDPDEVLRGLS